MVKNPAGAVLEPGRSQVAPSCPVIGSSVGWFTTDGAAGAIGSGLGRGPHPTRPEPSLSNLVPLWLVSRERASADRERAR